MSNNTIGLKGASGLGDSIYGYPIVKHYAEKHKTVYHMSNYPELYESIENAEIYPHQKVNYITTPDGQQPIDTRFTYCGKKYTPGTSQFRDSVTSAKIRKNLDLYIPWTIKNEELCAEIKARAKGKKICIFAAPYEPFGREDEWGKSMRINKDSMAKIVHDPELNEKVYFVQTGNKYVLHQFDNVYDMVNQTSVSDLMDLVSISDICLSQIGNMLPMAECRKKNNFIIFSEAARTCGEKFIEAITPDKTVHYKKLNTSVYDNDRKIAEKFNEVINTI
jgi:hypothetical protein